MHRKESKNHRNKRYQYGCLINIEIKTSLKQQQFQTISFRTYQLYNPKKFQKYPGQLPLFFPFSRNFVRKRAQQNPEAKKIEVNKNGSKVSNSDSARRAVNFSQKISSRGCNQGKLRKTIFCLRKCRKMSPTSNPSCAMSAFS